jgi:hypothetical protein
MDPDQRRTTPRRERRPTQAGLPDITSDVIEFIPRKVHFLIHQERTTPSMHELVRSLNANDKVRKNAKLSHLYDRIRT